MGVAEQIINGLSTSDTLSQFPLKQSSRRSNWSDLQRNQKAFAADKALDYWQCGLCSANEIHVHEEQEQQEEKHSFPLRNMVLQTIKSG